MDPASIKIDLSTDTNTRPTAPMRRFICEAEVGNEKNREDPTVNLLLEKVCALLGKEEALFLPSGTMCNQIAFRVHCQPGDEIIMDKTGHACLLEAGGPAAISGASVAHLDGSRGIFSANQVRAAIHPPENQYPRSRVISIEQTSNRGGGSIWPLETIREIAALAQSRRLAMHMDGARLLNAVVATGISASEYASFFDSVWIDFTKGLGAPVGAVLAGSKPFIEEAWRWKFQFGGAMRQAGIIAAGAVYALDHHIDRLAEDHDNARTLAEGLKQIHGLDLVPVETNLVFFDVSRLGTDAETFQRLLMERGLRLSTAGKFQMRAVTHLDVNAAQIPEALKIIEEAARSLER